MEEPNTLSYYDMENITVVKKFIVEALGNNLTKTFVIINDIAAK